MTTDAGMQVLPLTLTDHYLNPMSLSSRFAVPGVGNWTKEENKLFENALALFEGDWQRVAEAVPSKTASEVMAHYHDLESDVSQIEAGFIPFRFQGTFPLSGFTLNWGSSLHKYQHHDHHDHHQLPYFSGAKHLPEAPAAKSMSDQERKKGVPWTKDEHRLFLLGLNKYGKGDWRNISRNLVRTRTPTQVASHAQKYFNRQNSGNKDKRRPSIHDITTTNLPDSVDCRPRIY